MASRTVFSPPRNKPKISLAQPTLAVGQPMPQIQTINRPVNLVDDEGNVHGRLGENPNGPEKVTVTPPPGKTNDPAGGPYYASGGTLLIGGGTTTPQEVTPDGGTSSNPYGQTIGTGFFSGNWSPQLAPAQPIQSQPSVAPVSPQYGQTNTAIQQAQQQQLAAKQALLNSSRATLDARAQTMPLRTASNAAKGAVLSAQEQQNQMTKGVTQQEMGNDQTRLGELQGIYRASQNAPDLLNTAEATNRYRAEDRRASAMGVAPEAEVNLPPGYNGPRVAGVRPKIMSQEDRLREKAGFEDPIRNQQLQLAKDAVTLQSSDVRKAELAASRAGLTLEQANQMVNEAELAQSYSQLFENQSNLDVASATQPPFPGAVRSSITGNWLSPEDRDKEQIQYREGTLQPYQTQVQGQGSQLAAVHPTVLLNGLKAPYGYETQKIVEELARRYRRQGFDAEAAARAAWADIDNEFATRRKASGLPPVDLNAPNQSQQPATTPWAPGNYGNVPVPAGAPSGQSSATGPSLTNSSIQAQLGSYVLETEEERQKRLAEEERKRRSGQ